MDDFIFHSDMEPLVLLSYIIKIDFRKESIHNIEMGVNKLRQYRAKLLAKRVETKEEFNAALGVGFDNFQGNFSQKQKLFPKAVCCPNWTSVKISGNNSLGNFQFRVFC